MKHTKTPWELDGNGHIYGDITNVSGNRTATPYSEADAEFIVKACNNHEKLLNTLNAIETELSSGEINLKLISQVISIARAAIKEAS